jgi:hypothetical protein
MVSPTELQMVAQEMQHEKINLMVFGTTRLLYFIIKWRFFGAGIKR